MAEILNGDGKKVKVSIPSKLDERLDQILSQFPDDAEGWHQATDEIRELARLVRKTYNLEFKGFVKPLNFKSFKTPSAWNTEGKKQINNLWSKLDDYYKKVILNKLPFREA